MKFGNLKSKIEQKLIESYRVDSFNNEMKIFKKLVLENKKISSIYFLYDELMSNKGLKNVDIANEFINECIKIYENNINKITLREWNLLKNWVGNIDTQNEYLLVDNLIDSDILQIENKILSKKTLVETLMKSKKQKTDNINLPLKTLVNVANTTINKYIEQLDETSRKQLKDILKEDVVTLESNYSQIKHEVISKLNSLKSNTDNETIDKINESIVKITNEKFDKLNYFRLKTLNESI